MEIRRLGPIGAEISGVDVKTMHKAAGDYPPDGYRRCRSIFLRPALAVSVVAMGTANAQTFPQKPLRLIVPFTAGGAADIIGRMVAAELTDVLGQNKEIGLKID